MRFPWTRSNMRWKTKRKIYKFYIEVRNQFGVKNSQFIEFSSRLNTNKLVSFGLVLLKTNFIYYLT